MQTLTCSKCGLVSRHQTFFSQGNFLYKTHQR